MKIAERRGRADIDGVWLPAIVRDSSPPVNRSTAKFLEVFNLRQDRCGFVKKESPLLRQFNFSAHHLIELHPTAFLQKLKLLGDRGLADMQFLRSPRDTEVLRYREKYPELM